MNFNHRHNGDNVSSATSSASSVSCLFVSKQIHIPTKTLLESRAVTRNGVNKLVDGVHE